MGLHGASTNLHGDLHVAFHGDLHVASTEPSRTSMEASMESVEALWRP